MLLIIPGVGDGVIVGDGLWVMVEDGAVSVEFGLVLCPAEFILFICCLGPKKESRLKFLFNIINIKTPKNRKISLFQALRYML